MSEYITSANLIIYCLDKGGVKKCVLCLSMWLDDGGCIGHFLLSFIFFSRGSSERRINQCRASVRNTSPYGDGARKTDATYSINFYSYGRKMWAG